MTFIVHFLSHLSSLLLQLVDDEQRSIEEAFDTVAKARFFAATKARSDGRLDALVPASISEGVDGRLNASLGLFCVEERLQLCRSRGHRKWEGMQKGQRQ